jgi:hypothetical protein
MRQAELDLERRILDEDQTQLQRERVKQLEDKRNKTSVFVNSNQDLIEMRRAQLEKQVPLSNSQEG